ncbi:MAG: NAD-dependent protein deacylase [Clostridia bacterium]|nr:NAD-dependent protein deacylase [Clostridia bacterium]
MENELIKKFAKLIRESNHIVFFGGAGVSTESGIPDFRSSKGLYSEKFKNLSPEIIVSHSFFCEHTQLFYEYYKKHLVFENAIPNKAHKALAKLEEMGKDIKIITQNIDGLHQKAGSKKVYELHGTIHQNKCMRCGKDFDLSIVTKSNIVPVCNECGGIVKPNVVLYQEMLPAKAIEDSINALRNADLLIIAGTSLSVYPAASFIDYYEGKNIVLINLSPTLKDNQATILFNQKVGEVLESVLKEL